MNPFHGTTVLSVRKDDTVVIGSDGQVSMGGTIVKRNASKVRRLYHDQVLAGFAGGTADAFTLFERFENKLQEHSGQLTRAASVVVMPLVAGDERFGLLALGSADSGSFSAGKGTMFLVQFGELIACALRACMRREKRAG
ncbi:MAG: hypothetical protein OXU34_01935 [Gammaproteobacteria bacterium]|nr:hypothetical protein [Gammaproteobacteria bacterium]